MALELISMWFMSAQEPFRFALDCSKHSYEDHDSPGPLKAVAFWAATKPELATSAAMMERREAIVLLERWREERVRSADEQWPVL